MEAKIEMVLERVRPALHMHGGDIELVRVDEKNECVYVRFVGTCSHCAISEITLKHLIEREMKVSCPEIKRVIAESI